MKKINFKSVAKGIALSPVYAAGFVYGIGKHIVKNFNIGKTGIEPVKFDEDDINALLDHIEASSPAAAAAMNGAVNAISNKSTDPQFQDSVSRKEDTL